METANNTAAMHITETKALCSSLNCQKTINEEITREKEEELLYGSNEDGDDDDALSEDSFHLRVSDEEQQQTTNRDVANEIMKQEGTEMELGSDVPPSDKMERESLLKEEYLANGNCKIENNSNHINDVKCDNLEDFSSDTLPRRTNIFNNEQQDEYENGVNENKIDKRTGQSSNNQWHYSGHFGNYPRRGARNLMGRQAYNANSFNIKYYNQNTHYGRGRSCGRGNSLYHAREIGGNIEDPIDDAKINAKSLLNALDSSKNQQITAAEENVESLKVDPSASDNSCDGEFRTELAKKVSDSIVIDPTDESKEIPIENDNAKAPLDPTDNADSTSLENQEENTASHCENSISTIDDESSEVEVEKPNSIANDDQAIVESTIGNENFMDSEDSSSIEIRSSNFRDEDKNDADARIVFDDDTNSNEEKNSENIVSEDTNESKDCDYEVMEKMCKNRNDDEVESGKMAESMDDEKIVPEVIDRSEDDEELISDSPNELVIDETIDEQKTDCTKNVDEENESDATASNDDQINAKDSKSMLENHEISGKTSELTNDGTITSEKVRKSASSGENIEQLSSELSREIEERTKDRAILKHDDVEIGETSRTVSMKNFENAENSENKKEEASKIDEKAEEGSIDSKTKESPIVAIVESETIDDKTIFPIGNEETSESNVPLTDNANEDYSSSDDDKKLTIDNDEKKLTMPHCSLKRTSSELVLDEMELSKRIRFGVKKSDDTSESSPKESDFVSAAVTAENVTDEVADDENDASIVDNTVTNSSGDNKHLKAEEGIVNNNVVEKSSGTGRNSENKEPARTDDRENDEDREKIDECEVIEVPVKQKQKRSRRALNILRDNIVSQEDLQDTDNVRQKRKTAQNAEEIIRKEFSGNTDSDSNDSLSKFVTINHRTNNNLRAASPPTLKRNYVDDEPKSEGSTTKKLKPDFTFNGDISTTNDSVEFDRKRTLRHVRNFFRRDPNGVLCKLKQEELEELLIQKVVETLTMRDEIGKLREQAKVSERNQEATRLKCQQLAKQIKDFEMVLSRYKSDLRTNPDSKIVMPIKINRSVGLQVNFSTDHGIQNLRQLQQKVNPSMINGPTPVQRQQQQQQQQQMQNQQQVQQQQKQLSQQNDPSTAGSTVKRTVKVRSPRRPEGGPVVNSPVITAVTTPVNSPHVSNLTPAALVVSKPATDSRLSVTSANQQTTVMHSQSTSSNQAIRVNGSATNQPVRQAPTLQASKTKSSDLIDLTQEEDKTKTPAVSQNALLTASLNDTTTGVQNFQKIAPRFHTVIQTIPGNMTLNHQQGIRVVQPSSQPTPTALVNNMNAPRLTYVTMQSGIVPRQVVLTSSPTQIRPATANNIRTTFPISGTITNSTVRVIPTAGSATILYKHPAALPESMNPASSPSWKLPPPAPSLKISKVANGIVLSWNMALSDKYAEIASYQLYAYQEISGIPPSSSLWKKVGDVLALPLPMACTLTQFSEGNNYYFAVRAVDKHSRLGQYSQPGNISL